MTKTFSKKLILHIGPPKSGSSAIQAAMARHANALLEAGVSYPSLINLSAAAEGKITSGNGKPFAYFLRGRVAEDTAMTQLIDHIAKTDAHTFVLSSEWLMRFKPEILPQAVKRLRAADCDVFACMYLRNLYEWLQSRYQQSVKRDAVSRSFAEWYERVGHSVWLGKTITSLDNIIGPDNVIIRSYDATKSDLFGDFVRNVLNTEPPQDEDENLWVNRSLSPMEFEVMQIVNELSDNDRLIATKVSDLLLTSVPSKPANKIYDEDVAEMIKRDFSDDLTMINSRIAPEKINLDIPYPKPEQNAPRLDERDQIMLTLMLKILVNQENRQNQQPNGIIKKARRLLSSIRRSFVPQKR